jgi:hypothetical protein
MRIALGLFHFNPHWETNERSGHRHCTESLAPLLTAVQDNPSWTVTIEMSGAGLEWLDQNYPGYLRLLRKLVDRGRVELISSLYTPGIWVAFPRRDLIESVQHNQRVLDRLRLPWSRVFFAQEAFFGAGVASLEDYFDVAVCKDDYLDHFYDMPFSKYPGFRLGPMKVVVASSHLVCEITQSIEKNPNIAGECGLTVRHHAYLKKVKGLNDPQKFPASRGRSGTLEWLWYHCGDGNHFGAIHKPDDLEQCYFDGPWNRLCVAQMESYRADGYQLGSIREFVANVEFDRVPELPQLIEGSWNSSKSGGVLLWMGQNRGPWENDAGVLSSIQRARLRVLEAEQVAQQPQDRLPLDQAWDALLHAEISDALGWCPSPNAIEYSVRHSERAFILANQVLAEGGRSASPSAFDSAWNHPECPSDIPLEDVLPPPRLVGASGEGGYAFTGCHSAVFEVTFTSREADCGVSFPFSTHMGLVYCPSGMEDTPVHIQPHLLKPSEVHLPLTNGLVQVGEGLFLIKDTRTVHLAGTVNHREGTVTFSVRGARPGTIFKWRFEIVRGDLMAAVAYANRLNGAQYPGPKVAMTSDLALNEAVGWGSFRD